MHCVAGGLLTLREFVRQPLVKLDWDSTDHELASTTHATQPRTFDRVHKWEDFVPEARKFSEPWTTQSPYASLRSRPLMLVTQLAMQGIPLRIAMHLLHLQVFGVIAGEPLMAAADKKEIRGYIFGFLQSLTAIASYCGLREHLILYACMCFACHACFVFAPNFNFVMTCRTCPLQLQLYATMQARTVKLYRCPGSLSVQGFCHVHCTK